MAIQCQISFDRIGTFGDVVQNSNSTFLTLTSSKVHIIVGMLKQFCLLLGPLNILQGLEHRLVGSQGPGISLRCHHSSK